MQKRKRIMSVAASIMLVSGLFVSVNPIVKASSQIPKIDGSFLTSQSESIGYATKKTRGEDLLMGYSKVLRPGPGKIYAGGTTVAAHEVERVQISVMIERVKKEGDNWAFVDSWHAQDENTDRVSTSRGFDVEGDYYYRARSIHSAGQDMGSSFTDGIYIEKP